MRQINRVFIANRGEIALRIIRACRLLGIETVLGASEADLNSLPAQLADRTVCIGPAPVTDSYLNTNVIIASAIGTGADAIHPGYGFLAEVPELAENCEEQGLIFIGPKSDHIRQMGNKLLARALAQKNNVPVLPGSEKIGSYHEAIQVVQQIGLPVMVKAAAGGGGRGMKIVWDEADLKETIESAAKEAEAAFGDGTLYVEKYIPHARHIEVQILGDAHGNVIHLGERDCSLQRRHQKLVEEAPAPKISDTLRQAIRETAVKLAQAIKYENAGTVEFLVDMDHETFYFLEMNTRIQVEHPVTEAITGVDLVLEQLRVASGLPLRYTQDDISFSGHAIECRINAEAPERGFQPSPGQIAEWMPPGGMGVRLDSHCYAGYTVPMFYDSMIGKLIVHGRDREEAIQRMQLALNEFRITGIPTTVSFLKQVMQNEDFKNGAVHTRLLETILKDN